MNTTFTHLTKDERLMQKEMIQMYHDGKQNDAVRQNLISKDIAPDRAAYLAEKFREDYEFLIEEKRRKASQNSEITMITGWVLLIGGVTLTLITYFMLEKTMLIFYGAIVGGLGFLVKGIVDKNRK